MAAKTEIPTIAEKNRIIANIITAIDSRTAFLILGHENPDEDCIASMVAMGLVLTKLTKSVFLLLCAEVQENFHYLLKICEYNSIEILEDCSGIPSSVNTVFYLDTPKPDMIMGRNLISGIINKSDFLGIELDHHLAADSEYAGQEGYRLVTGASSTCEIIGVLAYKIQKREDLLEKYQLKNIFSRNFVIAVLTGIIGDSKMGKYLKTSKEKWFYALFSSLFNEMLLDKTYKGSSNFSNMEEVFEEIQRLSKDEEGCYEFMIGRKKSSGYISHAVLDEQESKQMFQSYDGETVVNVARAVADHLAEDGGFLSLVGYYDDPKLTDFVQFRMRRSEKYKTLDLRRILLEFEVKNGGGHPGAVGFRFSREEVENIEEFTARILAGTNKIIEETLAVQG